MSCQNDDVRGNFFVDPVNRSFGIGDFQTDSIVEEMKVAIPDLPWRVHSNFTSDQSLKITSQHGLLVDVGASNLAVGKQGQAIDPR